MLLLSNELGRSERGGVMFYIFLAIGLLAALTYFFTKDSRTNVSVQISNRIAQDLYVQANLIRSAIEECALAYPEGAGDIDNSGTIDTADNPNSPYPVHPYYPGAHGNLTLATFPNAVGSVADNIARNVSCLIPPVPPATAATQRLIFQGIGNKARFLPPPPNGWSEWRYSNDVNGVAISITAPATAVDTAAGGLLISKFDTATCQASWAGNIFTAWIQKAACP